MALDRDKLTVKQNDQIRCILECSMHLTQVLNSILLHSKLKVHKVEVFMYYTPHTTYIEQIIVSIIVKTYLESP